MLNSYQLSTQGRRKRCYRTHTVKLQWFVDREVEEKGETSKGRFVSVYNSGEEELMTSDAYLGRKKKRWLE